MDRAFCTLGEFLFSVCFLCCMLGCNKYDGIDLGEFGEVAGAVTYNGTAVVEGMITFHNPKSGQVATADVQDGEYQVRSNGQAGLPLGEYVVSIRPPLAQSREYLRRPDKFDAPNEKAFENIPEQYRFETTSGLKAVVASGQNEFNFEMK